MQTIYRADDGAEFETEHECRAYEFVEKLVPIIKAKYNTSSSPSMATFAAVIAFEMRDEIRKLIGEH